MALSVFVFLWECLALPCLWGPVCLSLKCSGTFLQFKCECEQNFQLEKALLPVSHLEDWEHFRVKMQVQLCCTFPVMFRKIIRDVFWDINVHPVSSCLVAAGIQKCCITATFASSSPALRWHACERAAGGNVPEWSCLIMKITCSAWRAWCCLKFVSQNLT